ncbi:MAG TPA: hypothetical protein VGA01_08850, partial [Candidatus Binatia bacterium]
GGFEVFDNFLSEHIGIGEIVGLSEAFILEPEDVEAGLLQRVQLISNFPATRTGTPALSRYLPTPLIQPNPTFPQRVREKSIQFC